MNAVQVVCGQNANRTKCQPDIMPTKGWHFVQPFFSGWHFVRPNFLVGILSGPSQHVLAFCPIGPSRCEISFSILFIQYPTHLGQLGPPMGSYGQICYLFSRLPTSDLNRRKFHTNFSLQHKGEESQHFIPAVEYMKCKLVSFLHHTS